MSKIYWVVLFSIGFIYLFTPQLASASSSIQSFSSDITIEQSGVVLVQESIVRDFGSENKHGIFRNIPYRYKNKDGKKYEAGFDLLSVTDEIGKPYTYTQSTSGDDVIIKIGDPDRTITGVHTYIITYELSGIIQEFSNRMELNFNVTGDGWDVPIQRTQAVVHFANGIRVDPRVISGKCFTGLSGSTAQNCTTSPQTSALQYTTTSDNLTIVTSFPLGTVDYIPLTEIADNAELYALLIGLVFMIGNFIVPFGALLFWWKNGRDPTHNIPVVRDFSPPKDKHGRMLTPLEIGTITDEVVHPRDISAEMIHLAILKYITIHESGKKLLGLVAGNLTLKRGPAFETDPNLGSLALHQKTLLHAFKLDSQDATKLKDNKETAFKRLKTLKDDLYSQLVIDGYFPENPDKQRTKYTVFAIVALVFGGFFTAVIMFILARSMGRRTLAGVSAKQKALGLKEFLVSQERQYEFQESEKYLFEQLLPYAIVYGVAKQWAKKFEQFTDFKPDWYVSESSNFTNAYILTNHLESNLSRIETSYTPTQSSSSSGFSSGGSSGGGFGGGGGGSW